MNAKQSFEQFERAVNEARADRSKIRAIGLSLTTALKAARKTKKDMFPLVDRATADRWFAGKNIPHPGQVDRLRDLLVYKTSCGPDDYHSLGALLLDPRYAPVVAFLIDEKFHSRDVTIEQIADLLFVADKSKGIISTETIRTFLGRE